MGLFVIVSFTHAQRSCNHKVVVGLSSRKQIVLYTCSAMWYAIATSKLYTTVLCHSNATKEKENERFFFPEMTFHLHFGGGEGRTNLQINACKENIYIFFQSFLD